LATSPTAGPLSIRDAAGNALTTNTEPPVAIVYSGGAADLDATPDGLLPDGENADGDPDTDPGTPANWTPNNVYQAGTVTSNFDDLGIWISRPIILNKLVSAGRIP
jgi:ABC-type Fe3+-hydroxamate transport system substrate-binding protein